MPKNKQTLEIDLTQDISTKTQILSSLYEAKILEEKYCLGYTLYKQKSSIEVIFPDTLRCIGKIAFSVMFEGPLRRLGEKAFTEKVKFICSDSCLHSIQDFIKELTIETKENEINVIVDKVQ